MNLRDRDFPAESIAREAKTETMATYEERLADYRKRNFTHIPLPEDGRFYHVKEDWFGELTEEQWISPGAHLLDVLEKLQSLPFLLYEELDEEYWIIKLADLNKRGMREMLYPAIAELESLIASRIEDHYEDSEVLIHEFPDETIEPHTVGSWYRDQRSDVELHIAEYMNLTEMRRVLYQGRTQLCLSCGFESEEEINDLYAIRDLRNKVMHVNRSLVRSRRDIVEILEAIDRTQELIQRATGKAD